jgi:hypothetical protein
MRAANPKLDPNKGSKLELAAAQKVSHINRGIFPRFPSFVLDMKMNLFALLTK